MPATFPDEPAPRSDLVSSDAPEGRRDPVQTAPGARSEAPASGPGGRCEAAPAAPNSRPLPARVFDPPSPDAAPETPAPGLYLHIPFCRRICPYCDFAVTPLGAKAAGRRFEVYRKALLAELRLRAEAPPFGPNAESPTPPADTVYFGGGTPSLAPPGFFAEILGTAADLGLTTTSPWAALEANPEDLAPEGSSDSARGAGRTRGASAGDRARQWAAEGITGVSLGAQSLREFRLRFLGRSHSPAGVRRAVSRLAEAGLGWISLDLIYGAAPDRPEEIREEFAEAASLPGLTHLSAYELTVEPATAFGRRAAAGERLTRPDGEGGGFFRLVHRTLADAGFPAYEASNFARSREDRSRHNPKYWRGAPYLGCGPSAHSFVPGVPGRRARPPGADGSAAPARRFWNRRALGDWQEALAAGRLPTGGSEAVPPAGLALEELFLRLRTTDGLDLAGFAARHGIAVVEANRARFRNWRERGLVSFHDEGEGAILRPTLDGLAVAEALAAEVDLAPLAATTRAAPAVRVSSPPPAPPSTARRPAGPPSTAPSSARRRLAPVGRGGVQPAGPPSTAPSSAQLSSAAPRPATPPPTAPRSATPPSAARSPAASASAPPRSTVRLPAGPPSPSPTPPPASPDRHAPSAPSAAAPGIPA